MLPSGLTLCRAGSARLRGSPFPRPAHRVEDGLGPMAGRLLAADGCAVHADQPGRPRAALPRRVRRPHRLDAAGRGAGHASGPTRCTTPDRVPSAASRTASPRLRGQRARPVPADGADPAARSAGVPELGHAPRRKRQPGRSAVEGLDGAPASPTASVRPVLACATPTGGPDTNLVEPGWVRPIGTGATGTITAATRPAGSTVTGRRGQAAIYHQHPPGRTPPPVTSRSGACSPTARNCRVEGPSGGRGGRRGRSVQKRAGLGRRVRAPSGPAGRPA